MAPKRKRNANSAELDGQRPSPHRPNALPLAQTHSPSSNNDHSRRGGGGRRISRGNSRQPNNQFASQAGARSQPSPSITSPQQQTPTTPAPAPAPSIPSAKTEMNPPPIPEPAAPVPPAFLCTVPYVYEFLTDETVAQWKGAGQEKLKTKGLAFFAADDVISLSILFQEVMRSVINARLNPKDGGAFVADILKQDVDSDDSLSITRSFLDNFSTLTEPGLGNVSIWREFLINTNIPAALMREQLQDTTLVSLELVRPTFPQWGTRHNTAVLYKQTTYNLLREDTEGYAKLVSEYYLAAESGPPTSEVVKETFEKVKSLVGAFNIDPGRTLDVTLDVFGDMLIKRHRFFVRYLRASSFWPQKHNIAGVTHDDPGFSSLPPWAHPDCAEGYLNDEDRSKLDQLKQARDVSFWTRAREIGLKAFFELGGRRILTGDENLDALPEGDRQWIETTKTYSPGGNKIAAQLLGFKLRYYASDFRDVTTIFPDNLVWLAALLIHIGFISLRDIYPHLYPLDADMDKVKQRLTKEKEDRELKKRPGGGMNALMMAGALADDTLPPPRRGDAARDTTTSQDKDKQKAEDEEEKPKLPEPVNQKILLLKSLLLLGSLPEALFILGQFPWLIELDPDLTKYINRILNYSLSKVAEPHFPLKNHQPAISQPQSLVSEQSGLPKGVLASKTPDARKILKWGKLDSSDPTNTADYKFYWDDWSDNVPVCQTIEDVFTFCSTFLNVVGVRIGEDPDILVKLTRIGINSLNQDQTDANKLRWIDLSKRLIVPALSFTEGNTGLVNEVWTLLEQFTLQERYSIYAEWYLGSTSRLPEMKAVFDVARTRTKDVLKRISKTNIREQARALAKVAYSSPGIVFSVTLNQIESYENLIDVVVECARFFTAISFDVLTWSILSSLGAGGRNRMQADGMLTSQWLRALSVFASTVFRRYPFMKPEPILRYITEQLIKGHSEDLEVLEQIVLGMAGIRSDTKYGEEQVRAMSGGPILRAQTLKQLLDKRYEPLEKKNAKRLIEALTPGNLAGQLLILIAQEKELYIFRGSSENAPLKVLASNVDKIHDAFVQYLDLIRGNVSTEKFKQLIPEVDRLIKEFDLTPSMAFAICRESIRFQLSEAEKIVAEADKAKAAELKEKAAEETAKSDADAVMADADQTETGKDPESVEQVNGTKDVAMVDATEDAKIQEKNPPTNNPAMLSLIERLRAALNPEFEEVLGLQFYIRFWQMSLHDLFVPKYELETSRIRDEIRAVGSDRRDISSDAAKKREAEKKRLVQLQDDISKEMKSHVQSFSATRARLNKEKDGWLTNVPFKQQSKIADAILQECIFPRATFSAEDAVYTWRFVLHCHMNGVLGFRTMHLFDKLFKENFLRNALFQCTSREAENFGSFLLEILKELNIWRKSKDNYEKSAWGVKQDLGGFCLKVKQEDWTPDTRLGFEDFRRLLYKWHNQIYAAIKACLASNEYMHVRNAIVLLKAIHPAYPRVAFHGQQLTEGVTNLSKTDPRADLKLSALSLLGDLKKREKEWILPQDFRFGTGQSSSQSVTDKEKDGKADGRNLDPKAPEFQSSKSAYV
jgi:THO complex subunit 2